MQARFLFGPAGSGKTFRCLSEIRAALAKAPDGPPLLLIGPKQSTYQLERQLLADGRIQGYTRLQILSFERLAYYIFQRLGQSPPNLLSEEGRIMAFRGILSRRRSSLQLFRASARLTGFARQLSTILRELQAEQSTPQTLRDLAANVQGSPTLSSKLLDFALILEEYLKWLDERGLKDADCLIPAATRLLNPLPSTVAPGDRNAGQKAALQPQSRKGATADNPLLPGVFESDDAGSGLAGGNGLDMEGIWVDGFIELGANELELLAAVLNQTRRATITFSLDQPALQKLPWLSTWSVPQQSFERCHKRLSDVPGINIAHETMASIDHSKPGEIHRFASSAQLQRLERGLADAFGAAADAPPFSEPGQPEQAATPAARHGATGPQIASLRILCCSNPNVEAVEAARTIIRHVRNGGRFREVALLVRRLDQYAAELQRVFSRYNIPCFFDQRQPVSHHPLPELTRSALRTIAFQWQHADWFAALKTGLLDASEDDIDRLETEALARGWKGSIWQEPIFLKNGDSRLNTWLAEMHRRLLPPFQRLVLALGRNSNQLTGPDLAAALREFWQSVRAEEKLQQWSSVSLDADKKDFAPAIHASVWTQMGSVLESLELGFADERLTLREWLPILEAGLGGLTVGLIPPALDQVLVGAVDRSRNPEVKLALILGLNEGVFPATSAPAVLLTDSERETLADRGMPLPSGTRPRLSRERYLFYHACTRASGQLVLSYSLNDASGSPLNPSPFLSSVRHLFPGLATTHFTETHECADAEHYTELLGAALRVDEALDVPEGWSEIFTIPPLKSTIESLRPLRLLAEQEKLATELADRVYGRTLVTSVSKMEQFAACPFKFFVHSGLRADERKEFELDVREQGSFQHEALARFHQQLHLEHKRWRDLSTGEARRRIGEIGKGLLVEYRDGLLQVSEESRFLGSVLVSSLQDFIETLVGWMHTQYQFDPAAVELPFGKAEDMPPWTIELGEGRQLALQGRIDRIDLYPVAGTRDALCVVVDYKSSVKKLDELLLQNGLQLQLLAYLRVLQRAVDADRIFGVRRLVPAGVFYVNLRGKYDRETNRKLALDGADEARKAACRHSGRFSQDALPWLDSRADAPQGDQFNYRRRKNGDLYSNSVEALPQTAFENLLAEVKEHLKTMGQEVFNGMMTISPFKKGSLTACVQCSYSSICRVDPHTQAYRVLTTPSTKKDEAI